jgi:hypothetical protein
MFFDVFARCSLPFFDAVAYACLLVFSCTAWKCAITLFGSLLVRFCRAVPSSTRSAHAHAVLHFTIYCMFFISPHFFCSAQKLFENMIAKWPKEEDE